MASSTLSANELASQGVEQKQSKFGAMGLDKLAARLSVLNIWNPPHRKTMTDEERAAEDQSIKDFISEW